MRSLSLKKKACALLFVFTAFGGVVGTVAPAEAQTPLTQVAFWTRNRSVSFTSNNVYCNNWRYDTASRFMVQRGTSVRQPDSWFVCKNLTTGWEIVGDLFVHASYSANGWAQSRYELNVRVNWGGGTVWCGPSAWSQWQGTWADQHFTMFWSAGATSSTDGSWTWVNCQHQGNVGVYFRADRGFGTF
jgi:hypothetical protein